MCTLLLSFFYIHTQLTESDAMYDNVPLFRRPLFRGLLVWGTCLLVTFLLWLAIFTTFNTLAISLSNMFDGDDTTQPRMTQAEVEHDRFISYYENAMNDGYVDTDTHVEEDEAYRLDVSAQLMCNLIEQSNNLVEPFKIGTDLGMSSDQTRYVIEGAVLVYCPMYTSLLDAGAM